VNKLFIDFSASEINYEVCVMWLEFLNSLCMISKVLLKELPKDNRMLRKFLRKFDSEMKKYFHD
jgi:hypothetical protein